MTEEEIHTKFEISAILVKHIKCPTAEALEPLYKYLQEQLLIQNVSCMFAYHPENEEVGRVFRNTITNKWYYDEGLSEIIGWSNVEKLKET